MKLYVFPTLYFIDVRQFTDELIEACSATGIGNPFLNMEIPADQGAEDVADIVSSVLDCLNVFIAHIVDSIETTRDEIGGDASSLTKWSEELTMEQYNAVVECLEDSKNRICKYVVNPLNSSFLLVYDDEEEVRSDSVKPSDIDENVIAGVAGFDVGAFDFPSITGAEEFASGIGDEVTSTVGKSVEFKLIPRDSYDNVILDDLSDRITIDVISDSTGTSNLLRYGNDYVLSEQIVEKNESGFSYTGKITAETPGVIKIRARICSKTVKSFTYNGLKSENGDAVSNEDCIEMVQNATDTSVPMGSIIRVDRLLTINYIDEEATKVGNISNVDDDSFAQKTKSVSTPQNIATKLEN